MRRSRGARLEPLGVVALIILTNRQSEFVVTTPTWVEDWTMSRLLLSFWMLHSSIAARIGEIPGGASEI